MGWLFGTVARCEEDKTDEKKDASPKQEPTTQEKVLSNKDDSKPDAAPTSGGAAPGSEGAPKNTGGDPAVKADEAEKAKAAQKGTVQASSSAGMHEPVSVRKYSHDEAQAKHKEHEEAGGNKSSDVPDPDDEDAIQVKTVPYDPRFPATNQARNCYTRYNEYYKCIADKDEDTPECKFYQRAYRSICPSEWVLGWNEARENDNWFGKY